MMSCWCWFIQPAIQFTRNENGSKVVRIAASYANDQSGQYVGVFEQHEVEQLAVEIYGFKTFYNVFRNLENIPGPKKVALLKRVLDFHIQSTIDLISLFHQLSEDGDFRAAIAYMVTLGGQHYLSRNIGNQSLQNTIETAIASSRNDLKSLMLICVYADLRLPDYAAYLEKYANETRSFVGVEMVYQKARHLMLTNEGVTLPEGLISAFRAAYEKRSKLYGGSSRSTDFTKGYNKALAEVKREHLVYLDQIGFLQ